MSTKRMLIDAAHPEETRVVTITGNRLDDFDVEVDNRRQLKGNIYLAKVTRVEPSLQAAFVEYGGNRHGFLAFNEIHPDYYQIPVADREALMAEVIPPDDELADTNAGSEGADGEVSVEEVGGDDVSEDMQQRRPTVSKGRYKIQEVIKRRQILLIQVVKEERGNKGAALTTYISLAGRYCVLMPNTARGGGVSRKIASITDRKRLKSILSELPIAEGMAVIVRTAGSTRTKVEIKRDFDYLTRLWSQIRDRTMESVAPCLIHAEADLIKRAVRDLYSKDIEEVIVEGDAAYRSAKDFMKLLIPSHAKRVQPYKDTEQRLFQRYQVEGQLDAMYSPVVQLRSGGYIVINPTEALVSIDVNSGKSTRERNIEETALATNMEAAQEIARQLRLRDMAGLIVIDFIDMEVNRNNVRVERALKDAMKSDRARIQIGRISPFGLLELSRQRLRSSLVESSTTVCLHCEGTGVVRTTDSAALSLLRAIEAECIANPESKITTHAPTAITLYALNHKRRILAELEANYSVTLSIEADDALIAPAYRMDRTNADGDSVTITDAHAKSRAAQIAADPPKRNERPDRNDRPDRNEDEDSGSSRKRKRRPRRGRRDENATSADGESVTAAATDAPEAINGSQTAPDADSTEDGSEDANKKRRRRGRRGGRRRGRKQEGEVSVDQNAAPENAANDETSSEVDTQSEGSAATESGSNADAPLANADTVSTETSSDGDTETPEKPKPRRRRRSPKKTDADAPAETSEVTVEAVSETASDGVSPPAEEKPAKPARARRPRRSKAAVVSDASSGAAPADAPMASSALVSAPIIAVTPPAPSASAIESNPTEHVVVSDPAAAKTTVIDVGEVAPETARKGWWRRLTE